MKKSLLIPLILCAALLGAGAAYALGGSAQDPLISLAYLQGTYTDAILTEAERRLAESDEALLASAESELEARLAAAGRSGEAEYAASFTDRRLKQDDVLAAATGASVIPLAGSVEVRFGSGAVVDVTAGRTVSSGTALTAGHRYLTAEDTVARFVAISKTAVVQVMGRYALGESAGRPDYNAMAEALKSLSLLRGSSTAFGSGFDLENAPTRGAALIMFIRLLGEEEEALAYSGSCPFTDVARTSATYPYVAYAYARGYTNGYSATTFRPKQTINARQYTEFILRAMGYSSSSNSDLSGTLANAEANGVITAAEKQALEQDAFLRADLVYLSYYALQARLPSSGGTLAERLMDQGVFSDAAYRAALAAVPSQRLS